MKRRDLIVSVTGLALMGASPAFAGANSAAQLDSDRWAQSGAGQANADLGREGSLRGQLQGGCLGNAGTTKIARRRGGRVGPVASSIQRLSETWQAEHAAFRKRELRFHRYCYLFVDGVNVSVRLGEDPSCACWS